MSSEANEKQKNGKKEKMNEEHLIQKKVQILNSQWTLYIVPNNYHRLLHSLAVTQFKHKKIYIAGYLPENKFKQFLGAELMQAFCHELGTHSPIIEHLNRKNNENVPIEEINAHLFDRTKNTMMIFAYPILPLSFMFALNHMSYQVGYLGIVLIFAIAMMTDTFAYLIGCAIGKRRFIPEVSPKKSIAGVFGGFFGGILGATLVFIFFYYTKWFDILNIISFSKSIPAFVIIGIVGSFANQLGDLVASAYKRKAGIKDFSNIFPGHGGFMDRVDGMMFVSVVNFIVLSIFFV